MKNVALFLVAALSLSACGSDKKAATAGAESPAKVSAGECPTLNGKWYLVSEGQLDRSETMEIYTRVEGDRLIYKNAENKEFEPNGKEFAIENDGADEPKTGSALCDKGALKLTLKNANGEGAEMTITPESEQELRVATRSAQGNNDQLYRKAE